MRLQKFLAKAGIASRRKCECLIKNGQVLVNGERFALGQGIDPEQDIVTYNGKQVLTDRYSYFALNKPQGYLSTVSDPSHRRTIMDLIKVPGRLYPVGRLDKDSEGLMLLTNDGDLAYSLTHPKFKVEKTYEVTVDGEPTAHALRKLQNGILLEDGKTAPCRARVIKSYEGKSCAKIEIKIYEGRKREIRRMMRAIGHDVIRLRRIAIGPLLLGDLPSGKFRPLSSAEIQQLAYLKKEGRR